MIETQKAVAKATHELSLMLERQPSKKLHRYETRIETRAKSGIALEWLVRQQGETRCYWAVPDEYCLAGVGIAEMFHGKKNLPRRIFRRASRLPQGAYFIGGQRFDFESEKRSKEWEAFNDYCMILPRIVLEQTKNGELLLACHTRAQDIVETKQLLEKSALSYLKEINCSTNEQIIVKETVPSRLEWKLIVKHFLLSPQVDKVVPARRRQFQSAKIDPWRVLTALEAQPGTCEHCYRFGLQLQDNNATFFGASPELLCAIENDNQLRCDVLAGTRPRKRNLYEDEALGAELLDSAKDALENDIVTHFVRRRLKHLAHNITISHVHIIKLATVQHLRRQVIAYLRPKVRIRTVINALHPTPATLGSPKLQATTFLRKHEPFDRGWFAGPFGILGRKRGTKKSSAIFAVAIRSALISSKHIFAYAGAGLVAGSDPNHEADEVDAKLKPIHHALIQQAVSSSEKEGGLDHTTITTLSSEEE